MKNKICIIALILSLFLFAQYLYSHWPVLEENKEVVIFSIDEANYNFGWYPSGLRDCDLRGEPEIIDVVNAEIWGEKMDGITKMVYIPCYKETRLMHWERLWK